MYYAATNLGLTPQEALDTLTHGSGEIKMLPSQTRETRKEGYQFISKKGELEFAFLPNVVKREWKQCIADLMKLKNKEESLCQHL